MDVRRPPTEKEWADILTAVGPSGVPPAEYLSFWIREQRTMNANLQDCVQKYRLGLGGENVAALVIAEIDKLRGHFPPPPPSQGSDRDRGITRPNYTGD